MDDINRWTVDQLKSELKLRGYPVSGNKKELFERLHNPPNDQEKGNQEMMDISQSLVMLSIILRLCHI